MSNQKGFTLIKLLIALAVLILTAVGGMVVWEKKISPAPTPIPTSIPTWPVSPVIQPTTSVKNKTCKTDNDCPLDYWCRKGPGGPMAGGGYGGGQGLCLKECQRDYDCGPGALCQDIQFFEGGVGVGYKKGCRANSAPGPKQETTFPTEYSCSRDSDCVLKDRPYCCGEKLEYYKWCYPKSVEPETISCKGVGSCPGIAGSAKSCLCQKGKCVAIF